MYQDVAREPAVSLIPFLLNGVAGVAALNQSGAVWEMSPVGTVIERRVVRWCCDLAGLGPEAGGTFTSGGTEATFAALLAARAAVLPDAWARGVGGQPPVVLHGEHAHYAVARAAGEHPGHAASPAGRMTLIATLP